MAKRDYLVEAAKQIRMALDREVNEDYEAAFSYYKNGVDLLLNGVQLDPNNDRREAVKRKTTQYLKRAEEIFISHLQDNLGKGNSHLGGYSSLRFRPIRHLSSPVEDLEMCKVVGVIDKVLTVQSMVNKETFVVKSLPKSNWESRDQPTIIPQGVPYMVKLLRYYVSEDAVYLHLEHIQGELKQLFSAAGIMLQQMALCWSAIIVLTDDLSSDLSVVPGGRLFSKLHKLRSERAKEHPECISPGQRMVKLKSSYTSPTISTDYQHHDRGDIGTSLLPERVSDESPDTDSPTSWDETQQRLESFGTHTYIEETGCLQSTRSTASFYARLERTNSISGPVRTQVSAHIHPPAPSLCLHSSETQGKPALPLSCARVSHAINAMSELHKKTPWMGLIECSSDFEVAWSAADSAANCERMSSYAVFDANLQRTAGKIAPHTNQALFDKAGSTNTENTSTSFDSCQSSSPAILHLPLHCQTQIHGRVPWIANGSHPGSAMSTNLGNTIDVGTDSLQHCRAEEQATSSPTSEEKKAMLVIRSTDRAVLSDDTDTRTSSENLQSPSSPLCHGTPLSREPGEGVEEAWELLSPGGKDAPLGGGSFSHLSDPSAQRRRGDMDAFLRSEVSAGQGEDQTIEVDGWCHVPHFPTKSSRAKEKAMQACWGLPEAEVRVWGAQILLALESLHQQGILCRDLNPKNILLTNNGKVCLTFFGQWSEVQSEIGSKAMEQMYCAPEIGGVSKITEACDWWSLGALLFELLTAMPLWQLHPAGIHSHTQLLIPDHLSTAAASLLTELLQFDAGYRLGSGGGGVSDIKCHPFFSGVSWKALSC
ncbi:ribosomal protein S6 kinase-like 1 [Lampris incognitus]|uniref:ribosomal protein S6 kinase-like 1 n=1 Tax=Lampris incognitus TaxID=2546036 RepID=UPI0024B4854E|nr:ribosomal protein S6 kinase-like 1 [Lampris incognitus]